MTETSSLSAGQKFADSVLALHPRVAVFDCDGTLWSGDSGADFFFWEIERGLIPADVISWALPRYADYQAGNVAEAGLCGELVAINAGTRDRRREEAAEDVLRRGGRGRAAR